VAVAPTWTGLYLGVNGGWGWTSSSNVTFDTVPVGGFPAFTFAQNASGPVFGGQLGYNWQAGNWVFGVEGDVDGVGTQKNFKSFAEPTTGLTFSASASPNWLASLRGRLGYTWGPGMIYLTGGGAWEGVQFNTSDAVASSSFTNTRSGWTIGGGYEWMIAPNWMVRAEYLYYGFSGTVNNVTPILGGGVSHSWSNTNTSVARIGLNYKFDWWH
jgi:outer membrane immunogenic protein